MMLMGLLLLNVRLNLVYTYNSLGDPQMVQFLLDKGAKLTVHEHGKYLDIATAEGNIDIVNILDRKGFKNKVKKGVMQALIERNEKLIPRKNTKLNDRFMKYLKLPIKSNETTHRYTPSTPNNTIIPRKSKTTIDLQISSTEHSLESSIIINTVPKTMQFNSYKRLARVN